MNYKVGFWDGKTTEIVNFEARTKAEARRIAKQIATERGLKKAVKIVDDEGNEP